MRTPPDKRGNYRSTLCGTLLLCRVDAVHGDGGTGQNGDSTTVWVQLSLDDQTARQRPVREPPVTLLLRLTSDENHFLVLGRCACRHGEQFWSVKAMTRPTTPCVLSHSVGYAVQQLLWSNGLNDRAHIEEVTDEKIDGAVVATSAFAQLSVSRANAVDDGGQRRVQQLAHLQGVGPGCGPGFGSGECSIDVAAELFEQSGADVAG